jgi:hypothetical protein
MEHAEAKENVMPDTSSGAVGGDGRHNLSSGALPGAKR